MTQERILQVQRSLHEKGYEALFTDDPKLLFYLTGMEFSSGSLAMATKGYPHLYLDGRYTTQAIPLKDHFEIHSVASSELLSSILSSSLKTTGQVAFAPSRTTYSTYLRLQSSFKILVPDDEFFANIRRKKEKEELFLIQKACDITQEVMKKAFTLCTKGISEKELACQIKRLFLEKNADISFDPIVSFGKNTACPHWHPSDDRLDNQDIVLIDCGAYWNHYAADMTRVLFLKPPKGKLKKAFLAVQSAYETAAHAAKPGVTCSYLDSCAREVLKEAKLEAFFTHSLGHGIGLNVHEAPRLSKTAHRATLVEGDVFTIEPGVYLPGIGGIRLENTLVVGKKGVRSLMDMPFYNELSQGD